MHVVETRDDSVVQLVDPEDPGKLQRAGVHGWR